MGLQGHLPVGFDDLRQGGALGDLQLSVVTGRSVAWTSCSFGGFGSFRPEVMGHGEVGGVWQNVDFNTGWWFEPLSNILVNWDDYSQYMGK